MDISLQNISRIPYDRLDDTQTTSNDAISIENVRNNYQSFKVKQRSINETRLIEILGGADAILQHYISSNNLQPFTQTQLHELNLLITDHNGNDTPHHRSSPSTISILPISSQNTFMHRICGYRIADKIMNILFSKLLIIIISLVCIIRLSIGLLWSSGVIPWSQICWIYSWIAALIMILFVIPSLLALNITTTKIILSSFEFYIKVVYALKFGICWMIYWDSTPEYKNLPYYLVFAVATLMIVLWYALMDGLQLSLRVKIGIGVTVSLWFLYWSTYSTLVLREAYLVELHFWDYYSLEIDLREWTASSCRIVTVFICKQTIYSLWRPSESTLLATRVKTVWQ